MTVDPAADRELLVWIPRTAQRVYEMGALDERLATAYRRINPQIQWHRRSLASMKQPLAEPVDCLVYNGAIETADDPWSLLRQHAAMLSDDGAVVARVRNVQYWPLIVDLLRGRWRYRETAPPVRGDLRFFTRSTLFDLFEASGLTVDEVRDCIDPSAPSLESCMPALQPLLATIGVDSARFAQAVRVGSFLVRAGRRPKRPLLIQGTTLSRRNGGVVPLRMHAPLAAVATAPGVRLQLNASETAMRLQTHPEDRIWILQRPELALHHAEEVLNFHRAGYVTVLEIDDDLTQTPFQLVHQQVGFHVVHAIQTSTPELAKRLRRFNREIAVFPNQLAEIDPLPPPHDGPCRLLYAAMQRERDWQPIVAPLNRLLASRPDISVQVVMDRAFFEALATPNKQIYPYLDYDDYRRVLANADVNLAPLLDTPFNRAKSDVKFLESAAHGVALAASPTVYGATIRDGETGILFEDAVAFERKLPRLLDDASYRRRLAEAAYAYVRDHRMQSCQVPERLAWYRDLVRRKAELDRAVARRWRNVTAPG